MVAQNGLLCKLGFPQTRVFTNQSSCKLGFLKIRGFVEDIGFASRFMVAKLGFATE